MSAKPIYFTLTVLTLMVSISHTASAQQQPTKTVPEINLWYGTEQKFGHLGNSQPLINIVGSIRPKSSVADPSYRINGGKSIQFFLGTDLHRLANDGDFNLEIDRSKLKRGENTISIRARSLKGNAITQDVVVHYNPRDRWKLPYEIDFSEVTNIQDAVEVIDGKWEITKDGLHIAEPYYDRQISFGDKSWTDYELYAELIIHRHFPAINGRNRGGPPYLSHVHTSFNLRWGGHPDDGYSPRRDWMQLGSLVALRADFAQQKKGSYWWLHYGKSIPGKPAKRSIADHSNRISILEGQRYMYRMRVETVAKDQSRYSTKVWPSDGQEPEDWQLAGIDLSETLPQGGVVFVVHHSDATLCKIKVTGLTGKQN